MVGLENTMKYWDFEKEELQFIHRGSSTNNFVKIKSKAAYASDDDESHNKVEHRSVEKEDSIHEETSEETKENAHWDLRDDVASKRDHRLSLLIKGWFPYRKFSSSSSRMRLAERGCSSRSSRNVLGNFKNCLRRPGRKNDSRRLSWKMK